MIYLQRYIIYCTEIYCTTICAFHVRFSGAALRKLQHLPCPDANGGINLNMLYRVVGGGRWSRASILGQKTCGQKHLHAKIGTSTMAGNHHLSYREAHEISYH